MFRALGLVGLFGGIFLWSASSSAQSPGTASFPEEGTPAPSAAPAPAPPSTASAPATPPPPAAGAPAPEPPPTTASPVAPPASAPAPAPPPEELAYSEPPEPPPAEKRKSDERVSITFSPLHLLFPVFELQVEAMIVPHLGVAALGGIGSLRVESEDPVINGEKFSVYELGLQVVGYPLRDFSTLQLGAELLWLHVNTENFNNQQIRADGAGVAVGPLVGYKLITSAGFTFFVQGGFQYMVAKAEASDTQGNTASGEASDLILLLNLNLGWSF